LKYPPSAEKPHPQLARALIDETANGWVADDHFIKVFDFFRAR
jgi:hypothetical protein